MPASPRQLLESRFEQLSSDLEAIFAESREQARRDFSEQLNLAVRRLRLAVDADELCATLIDSVAQFAAELNRPAATLLDQLQSAGVPKAAPEDVLTEAELVIEVPE